ncbi:MAG: aminoglycoside phosphotransferase family protein [Vicinamibacterales bacterium]
MTRGSETGARAGSAPTPVPAFPPARERVERFARSLAPPLREAAVEALTNDASDRQYFRLRPQAGVSAVVCAHAGPIDVDTLPFVNVAHLLTLMALPVPAVLGHDGALGLLLLEDLGDVTLQAHLASAPGERLGWYEAAVDLIVRLQAQGQALAAPAFVPYGLAFDLEKLVWELDFFATHFLAGLRGVAPGAAHAASLRQEFERLSALLADEPRVLCHRDFHSRNLMVHQGRLCVIDFQDARLGPDTYDLVSLLRDSYVDVPEAEQETLIARFRAARATRPGAVVESAEAFGQRFLRMALQRNLKALGTFGFQASVRGNPAYLAHVPRTLASVRSVLVNLDGFDRLGRLLRDTLEELR